MAFEAHSISTLLPFAMFGKRQLRLAAFARSEFDGIWVGLEFCTGITISLTETVGSVCKDDKHTTPLTPCMFDHICNRVHTMWWRNQRKEKWPYCLWNNWSWGWPKGNGLSRDVTGGSFENSAVSEDVFHSSSCRVKEHRFFVIIRARPTKYILFAKVPCFWQPRQQARCLIVHRLTIKNAQIASNNDVAGCLHLVPSLVLDTLHKGAVPFSQEYLRQPRNGRIKHDFANRSYYQLALHDHMSGIFVAKTNQNLNIPQ